MTSFSALKEESCSQLVSIDVMAEPALAHRRALRPGSGRKNGCFVLDQSCRPTVNSAAQADFATGRFVVADSALGWDIRHIAQCASFVGSNVRQKLRAFS